MQQYWAEYEIILQNCDLHFTCMTLQHTPGPLNQCHLINVTFYKTCNLGFLPFPTFSLRADSVHLLLYYPPKSAPYSIIVHFWD